MSKIQCQKCGESTGEIVHRTFANGTKHQELKCVKCGQHIRFVPQKMTKEEAGEFVIPFGKWRGHAVKAVPQDYLQWLAGQSDSGKAFRAARTFLGT